MSGGLRQAMAWFHGWSGIIAGWVLYMMFVTGSLAVFKDEITTWMTPEIAATTRSPALLQQAKARLEKVAPQAASWTISLPDSRDPAMRLSWRMSEDGPTKQEVLARAGDQPARETRGGDFFYRLHYRYDQPGRSAWAYSVAMGIVMLSILVSGIITHKRFFRDFFTFRPDAHRQRSWLDAHLLVGVLLLPFHLMITYTGLIPIIGTVMPFGILANYGSGESLARQIGDPSIARDAFAEQRGGEQMVKPAGVAMPVPDLQAFVNRAGSTWGHGTVASITVRYPGDRDAVVELARSPQGVVSHRRNRLAYRAADGADVSRRIDPKPAAATQSFLYGLHMARFSETFLRWLYFIAGLGSSALIATGLVLWTVKRNTGHHILTRIDRLIERLNPGVILGLPIAVVAFFIANRLLPVQLAARPLVEVRCFFAVWVAMLILSAMLNRRGWFGLMAVLSVAGIMLPVANAAITDRGLFSSLARGDWIIAGFDLAVLATAVIAAAAAWRLRPIAPRAAERVLP